MTNSEPSKNTFTIEFNESYPANNNEIADKADRYATDLWGNNNEFVYYNARKDFISGALWMRRRLKLVKFWKRLACFTYWFKPKDWVLVDAENCRWDEYSKLKMSWYEIWYSESRRKTLIKMGGYKPKQHSMYISVVKKANNIREQNIKKDHETKNDSIQYSYGSSHIGRS